MSLYTRLIGIDDPKLPVHETTSLLYELATGNITRAQLDTKLGLSDPEKAEMTTLADTYNTLLTLLDKLTRSKVIELVLILAESGTEPYTTEAAVKTWLGV